MLFVFTISWRDFPCHIVIFRVPRCTSA